MACNAVDASPILQPLEPALTGLEQSLFICRSAWCPTEEAVVESLCLFADQSLIDGVTCELLLANPHEKQALDLIQNLRSLLLGCNESHALRHREALDVLLLLENCGDGGGSFAVLVSNVYYLITFLVILDDFLIHCDGYGGLFRGRLRR